MDAKICRYEIGRTTEAIEMPTRAKLLSVGNYREQLVVWAAVQTDWPTVNRVFWVTLTDEAPPLGLPFLGTVQFEQGAEVHVFDGGELERTIRK